MANPNVSMSRHQFNSNTVQTPVEQIFRYYEQTYTGVTGGQEIVFLPDAQWPVGVSLHLVSAGTAVVQSTDAPPDIVTAGTATWFAWTPGPVTADATSTVTGATAIRINITSGNWVMDVRA